MTREMTTADLRRLVRERARRIEDLDATNAELHSAVAEAVKAGMSEVALAEECGVTRMTIRAWLGKR